MEIPPGRYHYRLIVDGLWRADPFNKLQRLNDYDEPNMPLRRPPITIEDDAWVAADAFVGPDVTIGRGAILGARGCAFKDLDPWTIYGGNPAKAIGTRSIPTTGDG